MPHNAQLPADQKQKHLVKPVYLLAAAGVSCIVCINALRTNNLTMVRLRADVYAADQKNDNVQGSLDTLQHYVTSHMNTDLTAGGNTVYPPIQLKYTYARLQAAAIAATPTNDQLYTNAQTYCQQQDPVDFSGKNRVPCIQQYVTTHAADTTPKTIPDSLYQFDFVSPSWSPDLAGWTVVSTALLLLAAVVLWVVRRVREASRG